MFIFNVDLLYGWKYLKLDTNPLFIYLFCDIFVSHNFNFEQELDCCFFWYVL